jgi:hypothetical protein
MSVNIHQNTRRHIPQESVVIVIALINSNFKGIFFFAASSMSALGVPWVVSLRLQLSTYPTYY